VALKHLPHERLLFEIGLGIRVVLILAAVPLTYSAWFVPFLEHVVAAPTVDIWGGFLTSGGDVKAFPYGPLYLLAFGPLSWLGGLAGARGAALGLAFTVLALDVLLFFSIRRLLPAGAKSAATIAYWLSPITIYVCYWHGQLDVLPVLLLTMALAQLRERRFGYAGLNLGFAVAAKLSMAVAVPLLLIHLLTARRLRPVAARLILASMAAFATLAPFTLSAGFRRMVLETPEREKVLAIAISYGSLSLYVLPLVFAALLVTTWRLRRLNFPMIFNIVGVGFFVLFLLTPASPGWALWLAPFFAVHLARFERMGWLLGLMFSLTFVLFHLMVSTGAVTPLFGAGTFVVTLPAMNLALSAYLVSGFAIAFRILLYGVLRDPFFAASRMPLTIGIAGDSGSGKDTLADALHALFAPGAAAMVLGDDYHNWDRHKPLWRALTHLNPRANDLRRFNADVMALRLGHAIRAPHYDHNTGRMTKPRKIASSDVVIASGLHALHTPSVNRLLDVGVYLDMDETLRVALKLRRDVVARGHDQTAVLASLAARTRDSERYIHPQAAKADLILSLAPLDPGRLAEVATGTRDIAMLLRIEAEASVDLQPLTRALVALCGLSVVPLSGASGRTQLEVDGDPTSADIAALASVLVPEMDDWLGLAPGWQSGLLGIMQVAVLDVAAQRLAVRRERQ
jgi:uridine kinase